MEYKQKCLNILNNSEIFGTSTAPKPRRRYNRLGNELSDDQQMETADDSYYKRDENGNYVLDKYSRKQYRWGSDVHGFKGSQYVKTFLKKNTYIIRYGSEKGSYASPRGTAFSEMALPYKLSSCEYNEYLVDEDNSVAVLVPVHEGIVAKQAAWPSERGEGTQFYFYDADVPDQGMGGIRGLEMYIGKGLTRLEKEQWSAIQTEDEMHI